MVTRLAIVEDMEEKKIPLSDISSPALAYLGDCALEMMVRRALVESGISSSKRLNEEALGFVSAPKQAAAVKRIIELLTEEEAAYFKRGRNIGHTNTPKHASVGEYRMATGLEALFGYLELTGNGARAKELFRVAYAEELSKLENK